MPGEIIEHQAHAVGHAAVLLADRGVLLAGDMLSDVLIPLLDARRPDQVGAYETALDRLDEAAEHVDVVVPGHGAVAEGPEVAARLAADHAYIDALRRGEEPVDPRLGPDADWLSGPHQSNLEQARGRRAPGRSSAAGAVLVCDFASERRWTGRPSQGLSGPFRSSPCPRACPAALFEPRYLRPQNTKTPRLRGFRPIAGAGFEPATFGL